MWLSWFEHAWVLQRSRRSCLESCACWKSEQFKLWRLSCIMHSALCHMTVEFSWQLAEHHELAFQQKAHWMNVLLQNMFSWCLFWGKSVRNFWAAVVAACTWGRDCLVVGVGEKETITSYLLHVSIMVLVESLSIEFLYAKLLILTGPLLTLTLGGINDL